MQFTILYMTDSRILTYHGGFRKFICGHYKYVMVRNCSTTYSEVRIQRNLFCYAATNTGIGNTHKPSYLSLLTNRIMVTTSRSVTLFDQQPISACPNPLGSECLTATTLTFFQYYIQWNWMWLLVVSTKYVWHLQQHMPLYFEIQFLELEQTHFVVSLFLPVQYFKLFIYIPTNCTKLSFL